MNDAAAYGDAGPEVQSAAETLRSVEALRRRGLSMAKARAFPLWVWAMAFAAVLPIAILVRETSPFAALSPEGTFRLVIGRAIAQPPIVFIAFGIAAVLAALVTIVDYRRQPVHRARTPKRQISVGEGIIIAAALFILGPIVVGAFFIVAMSNTMVFVAASVLAIGVGAYIGNRPLAFAAFAGLVGVILSPFIWTDYWPVIACGSYVLAFSIGAIALTASQRAVR